MLDGNFRKSVETVTLPTGRWLVRIGFSADALTFSGLVFSMATAWMIALGHFWIAIVLLTLTGFHDLFDGPVAKASKRASQRGAFFDSVCDRITDSLILGGVAYYLTAHHHGQLVLLPFAILTTTYLISYQRSKAESLGLAAKGGLMERAERMILLGIGFLAPSFLVPVLWVMLGLTMATAVGRFAKVWRLAEGPVPVATPRRQRRTRTGVRSGARKSSTTPSRWRARRQGELASRSGRTWRARQARQASRQRTGRRHT
jgi:CDP-diacylglycerol--glycerol-3-phosphate 3-phosphatidyltransferase